MEISLNRSEGADPNRESSDPNCSDPELVVKAAEAGVTERKISFTRSANIAKKIRKSYDSTTVGEIRKTTIWLVDEMDAAGVPIGDRTLCALLRYAEFLVNALPDGRNF